MYTHLDVDGDELDLDEFPAVLNPTPSSYQYVTLSGSEQIIVNGEILDLTPESPQLQSTETPKSRTQSPQPYLPQEFDLQTQPPQPRRLQPQSRQQGNKATTGSSTRRGRTLSKVTKIIH